MLQEYPSGLKKRVPRSTMGALAGRPQSPSVTELRSGSAAPGACRPTSDTVNGTRSLGRLSRRLASIVASAR